MVKLFRTLRFKLAGAFFIWTAVFQLAVALLLPLLRDGYVMREIDRELAGDVAAAAGRLHAGTAPTELIPASPRLDEAIARRGSPIFYRVVDGEGRVLAASEALAGVDLPVAAVGDGPAFSTRAAEPGGAPGAGLGRLRFASQRVTGSDGRPVILQAAYSLQGADRIGGVLQDLLLAAMAPGVLGAAAAGWIVAGTIARRIEDVSRSVREISASRIDARVEVAESYDEIARMAADLNAMLDRLAETFKGMEQFMSEVSHELKTPVAALLAEAQVMKYSEPTAEGTRQFISSVEEEMRRLGKLVESFLMLARFEHGRRYLADGVVSINDVVLGSVEHSSRMASQAEVALQLNLYDPGQNDPEANVRGDAELLRIVFDNLIRNAVQFSDRGSAVSIDVNREGPQVAVSVRDRGPGAPPEYINKIFERFVQAPGQKKGRRGTGLGLAIAKGVVELHSGTIGAANHPEGGCVFTVRLPMIPEKPAPARSGNGLLAAR